MIDKTKAKLNMKVQWTKFVVVLALYLLFLVWVKSWLGLVVVPFIFDVYITKKIRWQWWRDAEAPVRFVMSWVDALVFALVAVYFINLFFFQNYGIPQTPLTMPLTQHTLPVINTNSYISWPHWDYRRVKGLGHVELNDIVVFNYPAGDSILTEERYSTQYYSMVYGFGANLYEQKYGATPDVSSMNPMVKSTGWAATIWPACPRILATSAAVLPTVVRTM